MKATLYSKEGKKKDEVVLNPEIFAARINDRLLELVKNAYSANLRHGTADTKVRKEVQGGGKKPWRQKGTGRARHGSIRSPIWKGGGVVFGPHPRSYYVNLPRTMRREALISALSLRGEQKSVFLLEDAKLETPKTKEWAEIMKSLPLEGKRALCVVKEMDENLERASRNMAHMVQVELARDLNAYQVLQREKIIFEQDAVPVIEIRLLNGEALPVEEVEKEGKKSEAKTAKKVRKRGSKGVVRKTKAAAKPRKKAPSKRTSARKKKS